MESENPNIEEWEKVEVIRSKAEAQKKDSNDLRIPDAILERYASPSPETPYSLEYSYNILGDVKDKVVLDYGCGLGENTVLLAVRGAKVIGVDISPDLIELANKRIEAHNFQDLTEFRIGSAHELPLDDESVDVVFGMAILHHLDLEVSAEEVYRVLKKGGRAIFQEPVRNSKVIKFIRNLIPYESPDVSPFERPLTDAELAKYAKPFSSYRSRAFNLPFVDLIRVLNFSDSAYHGAVKIDGKILKNIGFLNYYASVRVVEMTK
jgi:SAM-dependent methyltransferase